MKKLFFLFVFAITFFSCDKTTDTPAAETKFCWDFKCTTIVSVSPGPAGFPQTTNTTISQCGLTEIEAEDFRKKTESVSTSTSSGITATSKTTCTKTKK